MARVLRFLNRVRERYPLQVAILFGSRARGDHFLDSDVDLLLVSESFAGVPFPDRPGPLYGEWEEELPVEILCYTPEEFERGRHTLSVIREAVREGIYLIGESE
ncbi:MAG: nucleotidyltransferase domain-containing protein [Anaerolineae bacterium]